jgi:iron complex transport system substrate-binding protein
LLKRLSCAAALLAAALGFAPAAVAAEPHQIVDAAGRTVRIADTSRIVALGGAVTEILYAVGLQDQVVGVDLTSTYPAEARAKPNVGYVRALTAEGVLSLNPTLVIAIEGAGPKEAVDVLEKASVPYVVVPDHHDIADVGGKIRLIAEAAGVSDKGRDLAAAVEADLAALESIRGKIAKRRKAIFVMGMTAGSPVVAGKDTSADVIFQLAGVDNAMSAITGFKPASDEAAFAADADAVVVMAERGHDLTAEQVFSRPPFKGTAAAQNNRFLMMSGAYLLGFGPRTAHAARDLAAAVYPELNLPELPARPWTAAPAGHNP